MDEVRTRRLLGRRPLLRDADELHRICADPRVAEWVWMEPLTPAQTRTMLVREADHWKRHRFGRWVVRDLRTHAVVGLAGLLAVGEDEVELAWFIDPDRWGEGLATEIAREAIRWGFGDLGLRELTAKTLPHNAASRAVMERCGLVYERDIVHAGMPHVLYRLTNAAS